MEISQILPLPLQVEGIAKDVTHSITLSSMQTAKVQYQISKFRLLNINSWGDLAGVGSATFQLVDANGSLQERNAQIGDYIRIELPAPGLKSGDGYDWVYIEKIELKNYSSESEYILLQVRPSEAPTNKSTATAHFFDAQSTSTFAIVRDQLILTASEHARNEKVNTEHDSVIDKVRNFIVAIGAMIGLSDVQWKKLVHGLLS